MTGAERTLLIEVAEYLRMMNSHARLDGQGADLARMIAAVQGSDAPPSLNFMVPVSDAPVTTADLRAVLALIADLAAVVSGLADDVNAEVDAHNAGEINAAAHRMAMALGEPERPT